MLTIEAIQKQINVASDINIDIDFLIIDNARKLFENMEQDQQFVGYLNSERTDRILKLAKLPRSKLLNYILILL